MPMNIIYQDEFVDGIARIKCDDNSWNFINENGQVLFPDFWFKNAMTYEGDYYYVQRHSDYKWNIINSQRKILSPNMWFDGVDRFRGGLSRVQREDGLWNAINASGNLISPHEWFTGFYPVSDGYSLVVNFDYKYNYINAQTGELLLGTHWNKSAQTFYHGFGTLWHQDGYNYIDTKGNIISPNRSFKEAYPFMGNIAAIRQNDNQYNFIDTKGNIISPNQWFNDFECLKDDYYLVQRADHKWNIINAKGDILYPSTWFERIDTSFSLYNKRIVEIDEKYYYISKDIRLHKFLMSQSIDKLRCEWF